jgi:DNA (cytosine-5)-methyltransferase 1
LHDGRRSERQERDRRIGRTRNRRTTRERRWWMRWTWQTSRAGNCISERLEGRSRERSDNGKEQPSAKRTSGAWDDFYLVHCRDGKTRRVGSGVQPLAHGIPVKLGPSLAGLRSLAKDARRNRVGRLKGYGNAIVPQVAAEFIKAFMDTTQR